MTLTLLLDLDDTLIQNSAHTFLPAYLQAWGEFMAPRYDPQRFSQALLLATHAMAEHPGPDRTLRQSFNQAFYPLLETDPLTFLPCEDEFYHSIFPKIKSVTRPVDGVVSFIETTFQRGYRVAIATNPFFPLTAIQQRLEWAGLPVERYPFALVPAIETFHFGKPHLAYFAEFLAQMGWPDGPVVMVGNDFEMDILPADQLGLATFWIAPNGKQAPKTLRMPHHHGQLSDLLAWLEQAEGNLPAPDPGNTAGLQAILSSTPAALDSLSRSLGPEQWVCHPQPGEWCLAEMICHLRDVDREVNLPRLKKILEEENPFLAGQDTDAWNSERCYHFQDGPEALHSFSAARIELLGLIDSLDPEAWQRTARHSIFGRTDLAEMVKFITSHDRLHVRQFLEGLRAAA